MVLGILNNLIMEQRKLAFFKVKGIKQDVNKNLFDVKGSLYSSIENLVDDAREDYARNMYWINERFFYNDVETPDDDVSIEEFQTEEGQHKQWNKYLSDLIKEYENGTLMDYVSASSDSPVDKYTVCYVFEFAGQELFFIDEDIANAAEFIKMFDVENVTDEYFEKYLQAINPDEIEEFVATHTQDEVEEKYMSRWTREHSDSFSMWEW